MSDALFDRTSIRSLSEEKDANVKRGSEKRDSNVSCETDVDAIDRISTADTDHEDYSNPDGLERVATSRSIALQRTRSKTFSTKSNALSRVASRVTTHSLPDPGPPPDGGFQAWLMVAMGWIAIMTTWGWINAFGVFQTYYTLTLDVSPSSISWIGTIQNFLTFFIGAFSGRLFDAGYFLPTVLVGSTLQVFGIFMMSLSTKYWQLLLTQGVLTGLGGGIFFTPTSSLLATYFDKRRAVAMGIASSGNSIGGVVYPLLVRELLPKIGFAWTARVLGFVNLALLSLVVCFMKPRLPPRKSSALLDLPAFTEPPYALFVIGLFIVVWGIYFTLYYLASFGVQVIGLPFTSSTNLLLIVNGIGVPARIIPGFIADKIGKLNTMAPLCIGLVVVAWSWLAVHNTAGVYIFACFYGIHAAAFQSLLPTTAASLTDDMKKIGTRLGMVFSSMSFAALTGPPIGGAIVQATGGSYVAAQAWAASGATVCAVVFVCARMSKAKWKLRAKV